MSSTNGGGATSRKSGNSRRAITREIAEYATRTRFSTLPEHVRVETARAFLNWVGCALGGCREPAVQLATEAVAELGGQPHSSIVGHHQRTDVANAAFVNCISSSVNAFDDAHLATVTHPTGPVAAALVALGEKQAISGEDFIAALALGIEIQCRISNVLVLPPAQFNVGFYVTGLSGPIGVAVALGSVLRFDEQKMRWAIGIAASQTSGFRATHGTMTAHFRPGSAARSGVWAAILASKGFDCTNDSLEAEKGFADVFTSQPGLDRAVDGLGRDFELLLNAYKPYPCGIVIHPAIDACLEIRAAAGANAKVASVALRVHPLALKLTGKRTPTTPLESHVSIYHWVAAALLRGSAGVREMQQDCVDDPQVAALRGQIEATTDPSLKPDECIVEVTFAGGQTLRSHIVNARGSIAKPMTDDDLDAKFRDQALLILPEGNVDELQRRSRNVASLTDVGKQIASLWVP